MSSPVPSGEALRALAAFLPILETEGFHWGGWVSKPNVLPSYTESKEARAFIESAYRHGWVLEDFAWRPWFATSEAVTLRTDEAALATATPDQLAKLLTAYVRADHCNEGMLAACYERGILTRIARRAGALL